MFIELLTSTDKKENEDRYLEQTLISNLRCLIFSRWNFQSDIQIASVVDKELVEFIIVKIKW